MPQKSSFTAIHVHVTSSKNNSRTQKYKSRSCLISDKGCRRPPPDFKKKADQVGHCRHQRPSAFDLQTDESVDGTREAKNLPYQTIFQDLSQTTIIIRQKHTALESCPRSTSFV